jgi:hypothetical protein
MMRAWKYENFAEIYGIRHKRPSLLGFVFCIPPHEVMDINHTVNFS